MALSSEHRRQWDSSIEASRYKAQHYGVAQLWPSEQLSLAVADHLAAVEGLLAEIRTGFLQAQQSHDEWGEFSYAVAQMLNEMMPDISALLGPAATEGGG